MRTLMGDRVEETEIELRTFYSDTMLNYWLFQKFKLLKYDKFNNFNNILLTTSQFSRYGQKISKKAESLFVKKKEYYVQTRYTSLIFWERCSNVLGPRPLILNYYNLNSSPCITICEEWRQNRLFKLIFKIFFSIIW